MTDEHVCGRDCNPRRGGQMTEIEQHVDWHTPTSYQACGIYRCNTTGKVWTIRLQWDAGSGRDDRWREAREAREEFE